MDYEEYEKKCEQIQAENEKHLEAFEVWLTKKELSEKTIYQHLGNTEFYLNTYLLREDAIDMRQGCHQLYDYFGYFFIRKCMWSTPGNIKTTAVSLKKFYKCMLENERIAPEEYEELCETIEENMEEWQETCGIYNDPSQENPFAYF
ncbi:MAG: hypothetical protein LBK57_05545 [Clostridiales Family XIII bacterium]|jgi:two-component SAPR family response regulator|nr:hypothetical protein [Clostridiales Family XIII bacterium]